MACINIIADSLQNPLPCKRGRRPSTWSPDRDGTLQLDADDQKRGRHVTHPPLEVTNFKFDKSETPACEWLQSSKTYDTKHAIFECPARDSKWKKMGTTFSELSQMSAYTQFVFDLAAESGASKALMLFNCWDTILLLQNLNLEMNLLSDMEYSQRACPENTLVMKISVENTLQCLAGS